MKNSKKPLYEELLILLPSIIFCLWDYNIHSRLHCSRRLLRYSHFFWHRDWSVFPWLNDLLARYHRPVLHHCWMFFRRHRYYTSGNKSRDISISTFWLIVIDEIFTRDRAQKTVIAGPDSSPRLRSNDVRIDMPSFISYFFTSFARNSSFLVDCSVQVCAAKTFLFTSDLAF